MKKEPYTPIACQFYDVLELTASRKQKTVIAFFNESKKVETLETQIKTLVTRNKEEFVVLENDQEVRLDQILSVGDTAFYGSCGF